MQIKNRMSSSFFIETTEKHTFYVEKHLKKEQAIVLSVTFTP